jgi:hypothetical protein
MAGPLPAVRQPQPVSTGRALTDLIIGERESDTGELGDQGSVAVSTKTGIARSVFFWYWA